MYPLAFFAVSLVLRLLTWCFRTPWLALFRVFVFAWIAAAGLLYLAADHIASMLMWQILAGATFLLAGGLSAGWAASHHAARKWVGYIGEGLLFAFFVAFFVSSWWWWSVLVMAAGAMIVELHRRYESLRPWRVLAPVGRVLAAGWWRLTGPPRRAGAALRARLSPSARAQRRTDRTFDELVATLQTPLDSTRNQPKG